MGQRVGKTLVCHVCDRFTVCFTGSRRWWSTRVCLCLTSEKSVWGHRLRNPDICWSQIIHVLLRNVECAPCCGWKTDLFHIGDVIIYLKVSRQSDTGRPTVGSQACRPSATKWGVMNMAAAAEPRHNEQEPGNNTVLKSPHLETDANSSEPIEPHCHTVSVTFRWFFNLFHGNIFKNNEIRLFCFFLWECENQLVASHLKRASEGENKN